MGAAREDDALERRPEGIGIEIGAPVCRPRGYRGAVSPRSRVVALTAAAAAAAAVLVVGVAALQSDAPQGVAERAEAPSGSASA